MLNKFSPDKQIRISDEKAAILADTPTLTDLNITYGKNTAVMFLIPQLLNISEFCGARDKFSDRQIEETAHLIASSYYFLKVSEVMTFCKMFKMGTYGHFYGSVDPMKITCAIREFLVFRKEVYEDYEHELVIKKMAEDRKKPTMSFKEWVEYKESKGEKVNIAVAEVGHGDKTVHTVKPLDSLIDMARSIIENKNGLSMKSLLEMRRLFRMQNGMTPEEVIEKLDNNEL